MSKSHRENKVFFIFLRKHQLCTPVPNNNIQSYFMSYWGRWDGHWPGPGPELDCSSYISNCSPGWVEDEAGRPGGVGSSAGVKLEVDLAEAAGQDGGPHVVLAAHADTPEILILQLINRTLLACNFLNWVTFIIYNSPWQKVVSCCFWDEGWVAWHHHCAVIVAENCFSCWKKSHHGSWT